MWRHVDIVLTDVSEEHIASIFRVEEKRRNPRLNQPEQILTDYVQSWTRYCVNRRFGGTYRLHLQSRRKKKESASEPA
jgi:hypothetical protein